MAMIPRGGRFTAFLVALLSCALAAGAQAQGLGGAAAKERNRRAKEKETPAAGKTFTNDDLKGGPTAGKPESGAGAVETGGEAQASPGTREGAKPESGEAPEETDPLEKERRERARLETEWRTRFAEARERLARAEADSWREVVRKELVAGVPYQMRVKEQVETEELKQARQGLAELEEAFRRTGLPPGWARE